MPHSSANLAGLLDEKAVLHPDRDALIEWRRGRVQRATFNELAAHVGAAASGLLDRGIGPGDRVLLFVPMSIPLYVSLLACLRVGATAVFLDAWSSRERLDAAVAAACPKAFIGSPRAQLLRVVSGALRRIPVTLTVGPSLPDIRKQARIMVPAEPVGADHPALVTFTTGSTGKPKGAARSHGFLWAQHEALAAYLRPSEGDVDMPALPIFVLNNLALGTPSVLPDFDPRRPSDIDPARIYRQIREEGVTTSSGSPAFYQRLASWCAARGDRLPLRALFTGGAPVLPPLARLLRETVDGEAHVVYGSTEAEPVAGIEVGAMLEAMAHSGPLSGICVGHPVPEIRLRVLRPCDEPIEPGEEGLHAWDVPPGETGEIVVIGRHVLSGYLNDPEAERATKIREGPIVWHRTGDAGRLDPKGHLWLMGRVRERVLREGKVWWSLPAELRALEAPGVTHAAYLGHPDPELGQRAVLCVETARGRLSPAAREELIRTLAPQPVDELRPLLRIPRDPRHASKTDMEGLRRLLG